MPTSHEWITYSRWAQLYGDILHLNIMGQSLLILSSLESATDLLEKRSLIYSDRAELVMAGELVGFDQSVALSSYDARFREIRKLLHPELSNEGLAPYWHLHEEESRRLVQNMLASPTEFVPLVRNFAGSIVLKVTYGYSAKKVADPWIESAERLVRVFAEAAAPGTWICDMIPALKGLPRWIPGVKFVKQAEIWREMNFKHNETPYQWSKSHQDHSIIVKPNLISSILEKNGHHDQLLDENAIMWGAGSLFAAGSDTTVSAISTCCLALALFPNVQARVHEELDRVIGRNRLPTESDRGRLPYLDAVITEGLRWRPVAPLGLPHRLSVEDEYRGHRIPKNALIFVNVWHILHNPNIFAEPDKFRPERFLGKDAEDAELVNRISFGFGRRACPGQRFAQGSMFIAMATLLATCKFSDPIDVHGQSVPEEPKYNTGLIIHPSAFTCTIRARHDSVHHLLSDESEMQL
ncbi:cytochrome P450 [Mycena rebaudengoi]|nr:cytochrome P450 [Mycena rebaudengoi]